METVLSKNPDIEDRQLNPEEQPKLPEGIVITAGEAIISDKSIALEMFDKDYSVFIVDENGEAQYVDSRADIEKHNGGFSCMEDEIYLYLGDRERNMPAREKTETERVLEQREKAVAEISALTGISVTQIMNLPADLRESVINAYLQNGRAVSNEALAAQLNAIIEGKPQFSVQPGKENYMKSAEELIEGNYNSIDGVINNVPPEKPEEKEEKTSIIAFLREQKNNNSEPQQQNELAR